MMQWTLDSLLGLGLLFLAWQTLNSTDLFRAIVMFISFGLLMALAWVRLDAPDIALAEAAIGAGLTGALLLAAFAKLHTSETAAHTTVMQQYPLKWLAFIASLMVAAGLVYTVLSLPDTAAGLRAEISTQLDKSGVSNPVTAVLLNFRGYDTLLEMFVLFVALLGVWSLGGRTLYQYPVTGPVLDAFTQLLVPILILVAAYLLWVGAHAPGGAFQAGSVLGAAGVLMLLSGWRLHPEHGTVPLRLVLVAGPAAFIVIALLGFLIEGQLLKYPPASAGMLILLLESLATLSIGATLAALFFGSRPDFPKDRV